MRPGKGRTFMHISPQSLKELKREMLLFVTLPVPKCIEYLFSSFRFTQTLHQNHSKTLLHLMSIICEQQTCWYQTFIFGLIIMLCLVFYWWQWFFSSSFWHLHIKCSNLPYLITKASQSHLFFYFSSQWTVTQASCISTIKTSIM